MDTSNPVVTPWSFMVNFYRITIAGQQIHVNNFIFFVSHHTDVEMRVGKSLEGFQKASRFDSLLPIASILQDRLAQAACQNQRCSHAEDLMGLI